MSRTEKFIEEHTKNCSNVIIDYQVVYNGVPQAIYKEWLTPDQARRAVEIGREELLEEICVWLKHLQVKPTYFDVDWLQREWYFERDKLIEDLKQAMRDEQGKS